MDRHKMNPSLSPRLINALALGTSLVLVGCASTPNSLPMDVGRNLSKVTLESKGQLVIQQKVTDGPSLCRKYTSNLDIELKKEGVKGKVPLVHDCHSKPGYLLAMTKGMVAAGNYRVKAEKGSYRYFSGDPTIYARYSNADFKSDNDHLPEGAAALESNQSVKSNVNYNRGDRSDWIQVKGKDSNTSLTLLTDEDKSPLTATIYWYSEGHSQPQPLGLLVPGKKRKVKLDQDDIFIKVTANEFEGPVEYSILRRDGASSKQLQLSVLDCYQVGEASSVVLLQSIEGMKVNDKVLISGKRSNGKERPLGKCQITTIQDNQAHCRLDQPYSGDIVEYKASGPIKGS